MQAVPNFKLIKKVKDEKFDLEGLHQYRLLINIGARDFQVCVIDTTEGRVLLMEDYIINDPHDAQEHLSSVKSIFDSHEVLQAGFWKEVVMGIKNNKFVQVPQALFMSGAAADYLKFNASLEENEQVLYCQSPATDAVTVFAVYQPLYDFLMGYYKNVKVSFMHQSQALISGAIASANVSDPIYLYVDRFKLHVLYLKSGKLAYYNQFAIKQFSDYVKYIMLVMNAMNMNQETSHVILWGYIGKNSPHFQEFVKYVRNVSFGGRLPNLKYGYPFDEIQDHHYLDLVSLNLGQ